MKRVWAILIWGVLIFAIGTYLDMVRGMLMRGGDPKMTALFRFAMPLVLVAATVLMGRWMRGWIRGAFGPGDWFMAGAVAWVFQAGLVWWADPRRTEDIQIHDSMFVLLFVQVAGAIVVLFALFGMIYYFERKMNRVLGLVHFFVTFAAIFTLFWIKYFNPAYEVRGYLAWKEYQSFLIVSEAWVYLAILLVAVQLLFVANLVYGLQKRS